MIMQEVQGITLVIVRTSILGQCLLHGANAPGVAAEVFIVVKARDREQHLIPTVAPNSLNPKP